MGVLRHLTDERKGIRENLEEQYFEFYVAGYTKTYKNLPVQANHALLYGMAVKWCTDKSSQIDDVSFPFGRSSSLIDISLEPEPDNQYDPNALIVRASAPLNLQEYLLGIDKRRVDLILGYVPKAISRIVSHNLGRTENGWIKRVRKVARGKFCSTKIAIPWRPDPTEADRQFFNRILEIVAEIEEEEE